MAVARKKKGLTRKEIKQPDEFVSLLTRMLDFYETHKKKVLLGIGAVILIGLVVWSIIYQQEKKYDRYHYLITKEIDQFNKWVKSDDRNMDELKKITDTFQKLSEDAPGKLKTIALFYTAVGFYNEGKYEPAAIILKQIQNETEDEGFKALIYFNLYKSYAAMKNYQEAVNVINEALDKLYTNPYEDMMRRDLERYKRYMNFSRRLKELFKKEKSKLKFPARVTGK